MHKRNLDYDSLDNEDDCYDVSEDSELNDRHTNNHNLKLLQKNKHDVILPSKNERFNAEFVPRKKGENWFTPERIKKLQKKVDENNVTSRVWLLYQSFWDEVEKICFYFFNLHLLPPNILRCLVKKKILKDEDYFGLERK